jgi:hypothetical protein
LGWKFKKKKKKKLWIWEATNFLHFPLLPWAEMIDGINRPRFDDRRRYWLCTADWFAFSLMNVMFAQTCFSNRKGKNAELFSEVSEIFAETI